MGNNVWYVYICHDKSYRKDGYGICGVFMTRFAPTFDPPAFCPNCGRDDKVKFVREVELDDFHQAVIFGQVIGK